MTASSRLRALAEGLHEFYVGPYRRTFARAQRDEDDQIGRASCRERV